MKFTKIAVQAGRWQMRELMVVGSTTRGAHGQAIGGSSDDNGTMLQLKGSNSGKTDELNLFWRPTYLKFCMPLEVSCVVR